MNINVKQEEAINKIDGPVLIIAGPGTGKTYTLVQRVINMVANLNIDPSQIMISTFTNKASFELIDRLSLKFSELNLHKDVNDMMIGNFHSIARRILEEYIEFTPLKRGYIQIDTIEQKYLINRFLPFFRKIEGYNFVINRNREVRDIAKIINKICEDGILERQSSDERLNIYLKIVEMYENILKQYNMLDFSHVLLYTYKLLKENPAIRDELRKKINYMMIDEYQDTNVIQEKIIFELLNENQNICVVGDDDQSLYRFRGATVKNILEFSKKFQNVNKINLQQNYRSEGSIIGFYSNYMNGLIDKYKDLSKYRLKKVLFSDRMARSERVAKITAITDDEWYQKIYELIYNLKSKGAINNYNEVALLFSSLNHEKARKLISFLKSRDIDVYMPATSTLISQNEIRKLIGALYAIFKNVIVKNAKNIDRETQIFLDSCYDNFYKSKLKEDELDQFILRMSNYISSEDIKITLHDICYRLFGYKPFFDYMNDIERAKKYSRFLELIDAFNLIERIYTITSSNLEKFLNVFFYEFIKFIKDEKISEFEEETKIPEENSVSALTIHASKGMEYSVVIMASMWDKVFNSYKNKLDDDLNKISLMYSEDTSFEPNEMANLLDFYRKNYTGFSRAKDLLVLAGLENEYISVSDELKDTFDSLEEMNIDELKMEKGQIKDTKIKTSYSFTADIVPYNNCPFEYLYLRKLKFSMPKTPSLYYGSVVHESIEYINKKIIKGVKVLKEDIAKVTTEIARQKYIQGAESLNKKNVEKAIKEVELYFDFLNNLGNPVESELNITMSTDKYVITGNVDMIYEKNGEYHIVDFKTGTPPDENGGHHSLETYFNQINLYAHLFELTKNKKIATMSLYFTDLNAKKRLFTFEYDEAKNIEIQKMIDDTVSKIENEEFNISEKCKESRSLLKFFMAKK
ncbi:UvrD-helicase domain-containing protein [Helcococcus bovis]|uniref:DNA 3'-5' helicase n=1 Tax=Helcococcus bovis TaxID=3153252 RepID=A0ABW9F4Y3_9FIRM